MSAALSPRLVAEIEAIVGGEVGGRRFTVGGNVSPPYRLPPASPAAMPVDGLYTAEMEAYATQNVPHYRTARITRLLCWLVLVSFSATVIAGAIWLAWAVTHA